MHTPAATVTTRPASLHRDDIADRFKWDLTHIFDSWESWEGAYRTLESHVEAFARLQGSLASGPAGLLHAFRTSDEMGKLAARVRGFASLWHDQDQRDNTVNARRQRVDILQARWAEAAAWFRPELLKIPLTTVQEWMARDADLALYRFAIEDLYRLQAHVLDEAGERLLSLSSRLASAPDEAYSALTTADMKFPTITLADGTEEIVTYGRYRSILATNRNQQDRAAAFRALHDTYNASLNTYASLYDGVLQRDWFVTRARGYRTTIEGALDGDNVPPAVVENLIAATRQGTEPLRRYHGLRKRALKLEAYHLYDTSIPLVEFDKKYGYPDVLDWLVESAAPLGAFYQDRVRRALAGGWIDVYENTGKRSGAYSAGVYGVHPYMLMNYNDTLDAVFTLAHEMGHTIHTVLADEHQPYVYSNYTIFVAEVPSTLSEALLLDFMLERTDDPAERIVLLQHAIDGITGTFYMQVLFADYELQAHRAVEAGEPVTSTTLTEMYGRLLKDYFADTIELNAHAPITWARIPHFYHYPYYVYQYATCFASSARIADRIRSGPEADRRQAVERFLALLKSGGSDYPMEQLKAAGVDLTQPEPVQAVVEQLDRLVTRLAAEITALGL